MARVFIFVLCIIALKLTRVLASEYEETEYPKGGFFSFSNFFWVDDKDSLDYDKDNGTVVDTKTPDFGLFKDNSILNTIDIVYPDDSENKVPPSTTVAPRTTTMPEGYYKTRDLSNYGVAANAVNKFLGVGPVVSKEAMEVEMGVRTEAVLTKSIISTTTPSKYPFFGVNEVVLEDKGSGYAPHLVEDQEGENGSESTNYYTPAKTVIMVENADSRIGKLNNFTKEISSIRKVKFCSPPFILHNGRCEKLCGYPVFSDEIKCSHMMPHQTLWECSNSSIVALVVFIVLVLSLAILIGNALVPLIIWKNKELRSRHNYIKVSLAIADMIIGFILICSVLPSIYTILNTTNIDLIERIFHSSNSPGSIIGGSLLTLSAQASVMHLLFLSVERLIAIKWPLWHRTRKTSTLFITIALVWGWSIMVSLVPAIVSNEFEYNFQHVLFTPLMSPRSGKEHVDIYGLLYGFITILLPYLVTTICILTTGITVWRKVKISNHMQASRVLGHSRKMRQRRGEMSGADILNRMRKRQKLKPDLVVFKTTVIMIVAFTLTILPFTTVVITFLAGRLDCNNYTIPYTVGFFASMSNSFVNVVIYSIRDRNFRKAIVRTFASKSSNYADMWRTVTRKISNNTSGASTGTTSTYAPEA